MKALRTFFGLASVLSLALMLPACGSTSPSDGTLGIEDLVVGTGATVVSGDTVNVSYVGSFTNGTVFDSGTPPPLRVGAGSVIKGFDQGLVGMRVGGKRRLTVPPNLGYGSQGSGPVPGNTTIKFDIVLLSIVGK